MKLNWKLVPLMHKNKFQGKYTVRYEQIVVKINQNGGDYPIALVHIDTFYHQGMFNIYEALVAGNPVNVEVDIIMVDERE